MRLQVESSTPFGHMVLTALFIPGYTAGKEYNKYKYILPIWVSLNSSMLTITNAVMVLLYALTA